MDTATHRVCVNTIKGLSMDAVQAAKSGHPGMPMGMADVATVLWTSFLRFDPADPHWPDRDRFVLSAGHGSMLLYSLLHLAGFDLPLEEIRQFRQWGSKTPGHPEVGHTPGVETTTGPLGQGLANGVGMAMAERKLREEFGPDLVDHRTFVIVSDGDLMEGLSSEAASLAGHLKLGRLVTLWDDNRISIDGSTDLAFSEDVCARFVAFGWFVARVDGHDPVAVRGALADALQNEGRPTLIACRTVIGHGSPSFQGTARTHGEPLGVEEIRKTKTALGLDPDATFVVPAAAIAAFRMHRGPAIHTAWKARVAEHPRRAEFLAWMKPDVEALFAQTSWPVPSGNVATRKSNLAVMRALHPHAPWLLGGSADLTGSNGVAFGAAPLTPDSFAGSAVHWGVREHAMGAACNGMALHGGLRPYGATFLMFHDYQRPSVRLAALMNQGVVWIYSHDSLFLGEDGPTHQPIESLVALRSIPRLEVWRPADGWETAVAWREALRRHDSPTALILTRQELPTLAQVDDLPAGARIVAEGTDIVVVATGSEVATAIEARTLVAAKGVSVRVVSMPCRERFLRQSRPVREALVPPAMKRVAFEAALMTGWEAVVGSDSLLIGLTDFGASAPASVLAKQFGLDPESVATKLLTLA